MEKKRINEQISKFQDFDKSNPTIDKKLDELIYLLQTSDLDSNSLKMLHDKFTIAIRQYENNNEAKSDDLKSFEQLDLSTSREDLADNLEHLLNQYQLDSRMSKKILVAQQMAKATKIITGLIMITLGFAMIIMPAPPYFEMFTIFYLTPDDGITLMDIISLGIIFAGVYLIISSLINLKDKRAVR